MTDEVGTDEAGTTGHDNLHCSTTAMVCCPRWSRRLFRQRTYRTSCDADRPVEVQIRSGRHWYGCRWFVRQVAGASDGPMDSLFNGYSCDLPGSVVNGTGDLRHGGGPDEVGDPISGRFDTA